MRIGFALGFAAMAASLFVPSSAFALEPLRLHATAAAARAIGGYQEYEFGWGGGLLPALELPLTRSVGIELELSALWLSETNPPKNPNVEPAGAASGFGAAFGPRFRPFAVSHDGTRLSPAGFWLSGTFGVGLTNSLWRPIVAAEIGYDFLDSRGRAGMGPMLGWYHMFQPEDTVRPDDANVLLVGVHALYDTGPGVRLVFDRDHDGIYDEDDRCPEQPEDRDQVEDADGCPDLDDDRDGIEDVRDRCPQVPEDKDGFEDEDGCPDPDNDKDGIADAKDKCPLEPEDKDQYQDEDGCPDADNDNDGIPDVRDLCPFESESVNDYADDDGCPDEDQVRVVGDKIVLDDRVHFMINSHIIRRDSFALLERLGKLIKEHPEYVHISIEGHADERGAEDFNQRLSESRAASVLEFVVKSGVPRKRLSSKGFGSSRPMVDRKGEFAYYQNRRVEFIITREARVSGQQALPPPPRPLGSDGAPPAEEPLKETPPAAGKPPPTPTSAAPPLPPPPAKPPAASAPAPKPPAPNNSAAPVPPAPETPKGNKP
jgi:outer membrane protein OmpA-like peptidoglycan-associated protein